MAIALWIVQGLLGTIFTITGSFKLLQPRQKIIESGGTWAEDFAPATIKVIAFTELVSGLIVILPKLFGHGHYLTFIGAATITFIMTGSIFVHLSRKEFLHAAINAVFLAMALFVGCFSYPL